MTTAKLTPIATIPQEGMVWEKWEPHANKGSVHAILFEDGTCFDVYNGWREDKFPPKLMKYIREELID